MEDNQIYVLVDNDSWILPYAKRLVGELQSQGCQARLVREAQDVGKGWINFMLGCTRIVSSEILRRNQHNLVVHESDLPKGRGFAPMAWQIIEGKNNISICLIEAADAVDSGSIWIKDEIRLNGTELCNEWRALQGEKTIDLCRRFVGEYENLQPYQQTGEPTWYERRRAENSRLDIKKTIEEQFNLLRTVDNERYPAFFEYLGKRYLIKIVNSEQIGEPNGESVGDDSGRVPT